MLVYVRRVPYLPISSGNPSHDVFTLLSDRYTANSGVRSRTRRQRTNVPSLREDDAQEENDEQNTGSNPTICSVRSRSIKVGLVFLQRQSSAQGFSGQPNPYEQGMGREGIAFALVAIAPLKRQVRTHPGQFGGVRRHGGEGRLVWLGDIHCEGGGEEGMRK